MECKGSEENQKPKKNKKKKKRKTEKNNDKMAQMLGSSYEIDESHWFTHKNLNLMEEVHQFCDNLAQSKNSVPYLI
jgi:hypothetical protein